VKTIFSPSLLSASLPVAARISLNDLAGFPSSTFSSSDVPSSLSFFSPFSPSALFLARILLEGAANLPAVVPYAPNAWGRGDLARRVGPTAEGAGDAVTPKADGRPKTDFGAPNVELPTEEGAPNSGDLETDGNGVGLPSLARSWVGSEFSGLAWNTLGTSDAVEAPN
jgi:hypothetical protein